jgi:hypothetical protein
MVLALALMCSGFTVEGTWVIDAMSQLSIQGSTNVNDFTCKIGYCTGTDTLQYVEHNSRREMRFTRSRMIVPVRSFDCGAKPISKDFWKTLKSDSHPNLEINFVSLQNLYLKNNRDIKGIVDITLAGVTTRYTICYVVKIRDDGTVLLRGTHAVNFADFDLEAPRKMKGLIKVKEVLHVDFNLILKEV